MNQTICTASQRPNQLTTVPVQFRGSLIQRLLTAFLSTYHSHIYGVIHSRSVQFLLAFAA